MTMDIKNLLRKLEPVLPEEVARWRRALPLVDERTRSLVEQQVRSTAQRILGDVENRFLLPPPPSKLCSGDLPLGTIVYDKDRGPFMLTREELLGHLCVFGRSGSGKTNATFHLLRELAKHQVPFCFLDWKRTARHLVPLLDAHASVYTPGRSVSPFFFNPLIPPPGVEPHLHVGRQVDVLGSAYSLGDGAKSLVQQALAAALERNPAPQVRDLVAQVEQVPIQGRAGGWRASALRALQSLSFADLWSTSVEDQQALFRQLLQRNTIIELNGLNDNAKRFLIPSLLLWLFHTRLQAPDREQLKIVVVIEEAHHVFYGQHHAQESIAEQFLRQCRELGIAVVIVDQHPHLISSAVLGNTYTSICMNLKDPADVRQAGALSLVEEDERRHFSMLPVGYGVVKLQGRWPRPFLIRFPLVPVEKGAVTDERLRSKTGDSVDSGKERVPLGTTDHVRPIRRDDLSGEDGLFRFLLDVVQHPDDGVRRRYERLGVSVDQGNRWKNQLLRAVHLTSESVIVNGSRTVLLRPTQTGQALLGPNPLEATRASMAHEFWKRRCAARYRGLGYRVTLEAPRKGGYVDLLAERGTERVGIEIETGKSDVIANVRNDLAERFTRVVVVCTDDAAMTVVERKLVQAGLLIPNRVTLSLRDHHAAA